MSPKLSLLDLEFNQSYTFIKVRIYQRNIFDQIKPYLGDREAIVITGARQVGKTYLLFYLKNYLEKKGKLVFYYDLEYPELLTTLNSGIDDLIIDLKNRGWKEGAEVFVLIDEVQYLENPSSLIKIIVDHYPEIHLIVSGSSSLKIKTKFRDSLVGRINVFPLFPLSFDEFLRFTNCPYQLQTRLSPATLKTIKKLYYQFIYFGGYPRVALEESQEKKKRYLLQVIDTYIRKDVADLAKIENIRKFNQLLKVLAAQSGQILDYQRVSRQTGVSFPTLKKYLTILEQTFVIKLVTPYSKNPQVEIRKKPKIYFLDSGLTSLLWLNEFSPTLLGNILETNIFSELVKKYGPDQIFFWRTKIGQEVDFIIEKEKLLALEVKTNFNQAKLSHLHSFLKKYPTADWRLIALEGKKENPHFIFPWDLLISSPGN